MCVCVCVVCVHICMCVRMYVCVCACTCVCVHECMCTCACSCRLGTKPRVSDTLIKCSPTELHPSPHVWFKKKKQLNPYINRFARWMCRGDFCLFVSLVIQTEPFLYILSGCSNRTPQAGRLQRNLSITSLTPRGTGFCCCFQGLPSLCAHVARGKEQTLYRLVSGDTSPLGGGATAPRNLRAS